MSRKSINIVLAVDVEQFQKSLDKAARKLDGFSRQMERQGMAMSRAFTVPFAIVAGASFKMASDLEENINKVNVAFGDSASDILAWSEDSLKAMGMAQSSALDMASLFGDMATSMGFGTVEAAAMSKQLVQLAADLASFKNIPIEQAQTALAGVFTGETESLKKLGVVMTEQNLKTFTAAEGMKVYSSEMSQAEKVQARFAYIMSTTTNAQGDFARTQGGAANQMRTFTEGIKELGASMGETLLPVITPLIKQVNEFVQRLSKMDDGTKQMIFKIGGLVAAIGPLQIILGKVAGSISFVGKTFSDATKLMSGGVVSLAGKMNVWMLGISAAILVVKGVISVLEDFGVIQRKVEDQLTATEEIQRKYNEQLVQEQAAAEALFQALQKTNKGSKERSALIDEINSKYGTTLSNYDDEKKMLTEINKVRGQILQKIAAEIALQSAREQIVKLQQEQWNLTGLLGVAQADLAKSTMLVGVEGAKAYDRAKNSVSAYEKKIQDNKKAQDELAGSMANSQAILSKFTFSAAGSGEVVTDLTKKTDNQSASVSKLTDDVQSYAEALRAFDDYAAEDLSINIDFPTEEAQEFIEMIDTTPQSLQNAVAATQELQEALRQLTEESLARFAQALGETLGGSKTAFAKMTDDLVMMLADFAEQFGKYLIQLGVGIIAFNASLTSMNGAVAIAAGVALVTTAALIRQLMKDHGNMQGYATGTNFAAGGLAMVGERGPELVNLPTGAGVTPSYRLGDAFGIGDALKNMNFRIQGTDLVLATERTYNRQRRYR